MKDAVIVCYQRSAFHFAGKGALARVRPDDLAASIIRQLVTKSGVPSADIEDVLMGCAFPEAEQGLNIARLVALHAGLPQATAGATINRFCGSSMQGLHLAAGAIALGAGDVFVCAGIESMSRVPMMGFNPLPNPALDAAVPGAYMSMGQTAENVARKYNVTREAQEAFALESHRRAHAAQQAGRLKDEIVPFMAGDRQIDADGCIRADTSLAALAQLKPAFDQNGTVTAGTSAPLTDGAAACLVVSGDYAKAHGLKPLARIRSIAVTGCAPELMGIGPVAATQKALKRAGLTVKALGVVELNEAFSSQALACMTLLDLDPAHVNLDGGAIALGHPLGATGARIVGKAAQILARDGKEFALATQCIGGGQGIATILEAVS